jgi:PKD repeat protein
MKKFLVALAGLSLLEVRIAAQGVPELAVEQIAMIASTECPAGATDYTSLCYAFALMDADGSHRIPIPGGEGSSWSPDGTKLLVVSNGEIFVKTVTGATSFNLTNHPANDLEPAWSPDGDKIAFVSDRDGPFDLYVMNADGSGVARLGTGVGMAWNPTWSPDSTRLAFTCYVDGSMADICAIGADGSGFAQLTSEPGNDYDPDWSPDGTRILFATERYGGIVSTTSWGDIPASEIAVMYPDGSGVTQVTLLETVAYSPKWSSAGTRIAFVALDPVADFGLGPWSYVAVFNADGTGLTGLDWGHSPSWRPWAGGSNNRPLASFTLECTGLTCTFDASPSSDSDGIIATYGWQFGDGATASGGTTSHTFAGGRSYDVRLIVMDDDGALGTSVQRLDFNQPPIVSFTAMCSGLTCTFDGSATSDPDGMIAGFMWRFGDGRDSSGPATMTHTYAVAGTYIVTLTATDLAYGTGTQSQTVSLVNAPPIASYTSTCSGLTCTFDGSASSDPDGTIASYAWSFGDATTGSGATAIRAYAAAGTYTVILTVTDNGASTSTQAQGVTVSPPGLHVGDLDGASTSTIPQMWTAAVTITIHDSNHQPVANSAVTGSWNDGSTASCTTTASGQCAVSKSGILKKTSSVSFAVTTVARVTFVYRPADNHDPDGDTDGTTVSVTKR